MTIMTIPSLTGIYKTNELIQIFIKMITNNRKIVKHGVLVS